MGLRDLLVFLAVFGTLPFVLARPAIGVFLWVWLSLMNPHRETWGLAYSFPFALVIAMTTLLALVVSREPKQRKGGGATFVLLAFIVWMSITTIFALEPDRASVMLERVLKIQLFTFIGLFVLYKREHVIGLVWTIVLSIGYYGIKGGLFTILTAGAYRVWGPAESFFFDNNSIALALIISIPLWAYLYIINDKKWIRAACATAIALSSAAALGSHSRGALLAITAMAGFLWLKGNNKLLLGTVLVLLGAGLLAFMPQHWEDRMRTISHYQGDESVQGRLAAWTMLFRLALDRPMVGGGFEPYTPEIFQRYLPGYGDVHSAHSIYFQVLGEHGFVGLALFLTFWLLTWRIGTKISKKSRGRRELKWAFWLARMVQVSLIAYFVGGAFLNIANWDMPYYLMIILAVTWEIVKTSEPTKNGVPSTPVRAQPAHLPAPQASTLPVGK